MRDVPCESWTALGFDHALDTEAGGSLVAHSRRSQANRVHREDAQWTVRLNCSTSSLVRIVDARYRAGMTPILESYGGSFGCDFAVAKVLKGPSERVNRVFTIAFPDRATRDRFFADERYRAVRREHFEPAVAASFVLAEFGS